MATGAAFLPMAIATMILPNVAARTQVAAFLRDDLDAVAVGPHRQLLARGRHRLLGWAVLTGLALTAASATGTLPGLQTAPERRRCAAPR